MELPTVWRQEKQLKNEIVYRLRLPLYELGQESSAPYVPANRNRRELHSQTTEAYIIVNKDLVLWNRNLGRISI